MVLTPNDILEKEFGTEFRGYNKEEVNEFLDLVVVDFENAVMKAQQLAKELASASERVAYFEKLQESLNSSILIANEAAERLKQNARKEAELIIYEAERESERIVRAAHDQVAHLTNEVEMLRHSGRNIQMELQNMLEEQLAIVTSRLRLDYDSVPVQQVTPSEPVVHYVTATPPAQEVATPVTQEVPMTPEEVANLLNQFPFQFEQTNPTPAPEPARPSVDSILGQTIQIDLPE